MSVAPGCRDGRCSWCRTDQGRTDQPAPGGTRQADPDLQVTFKDYGTLPVEEGAHVYGLHTETSWGAADIRLLAVGRDGRTVTVVDWGRMGGFQDAPVKAFKKTATMAVNKLH